LPSAWMESVVPCDSPTARILTSTWGSSGIRSVSDRPDRLRSVGDLSTRSLPTRSLPTRSLLTLTLGPRRGLRHGTSALAWYERGLAVETGDPVAAMAAYERALAGRPDLADAHNNLGRLHHDRGELAVAEAHYRLALCASRVVPLYWFNLGVVLEDQGRGAEAIVAYEQSIALDESVGDAHYNVARLLEQVARRAGDDDMLRLAIRHLAKYRALRRRLG
jgi:tetratricopeptide (TPR) repeat protein